VTSEQPLHRGLLGEVTTFAQGLPEAPAGGRDVLPHPWRRPPLQGRDLAGPGRPGAAGWFHGAGPPSPMPPREVATFQDPLPEAPRQGGDREIWLRS
jgi:hypothetical protein